MASNLQIFHFHFPYNRIQIVVVSPVFPLFQGNGFRIKSSVWWQVAKSIVGFMTIEYSE